MSCRFLHVVLYAVGSALLAFALLLFAAVGISAQSTDQTYPTAVTENAIHGRIRARDVGDARLTTYYYTFGGDQGDLFVNIVTTNLNGSIDVFTADTLKPLTKVMVYADVSQSETGRIIYLRKPEKLILRVEGRTPNDEAAEFQIKFAGSFVAAVPNNSEPPVPKVTGIAPNDSGVRVNSVGTIVEVIPKPRPTPKAEQTLAKKEPEVKANKPSDEEKSVDDAKADVKDDKTETIPEPTEKPTDTTETKPETPSKSVPAKSTATNRRNRTRPAATTRSTGTVAKRRTDETAKQDDDAVSGATKRPPKVVVTDNIPKAEPKPNPLANVRLVILFKDGTKVERPMTEVERFTVDQRTLTVVGTNGRIAKFSMLEVASVNIQ